MTDHTDLIAAAKADLGWIGVPLSMGRRLDIIDLIESLQSQLAEAQLARGLAEGGLAEVKKQLAEAGVGKHGGDTCGRREAKYRGLVELVDEQNGVIECLRAYLETEVNSGCDGVDRIHALEAQLAEAVGLLADLDADEMTDYRLSLDRRVKAFLAKHKEQP